MADFRKWLLALTAVALLLGIGAPVNAQIITTPAFACTASAANPPLVRGEGLTELVGDVVLNCTGGVPTPAGKAIPLSNIRVSLNVNITSRLMSSSNLTEGLIMIDEPFPSDGGQFPPGVFPLTGSSTPQAPCPATGGSNCALNGTWTGSSFTSNPYAGTKNIFQGIRTVDSQGNTAIDFLGVPIDAPGTAGTRVIRITNIRGDMRKWLTAASLINPSPINMTIAVNGTQQFTINSPVQTVAYVVPSLSSSLAKQNYIQCNEPDANPGITITELFAAAFKTRIITDKDVAHMGGEGNPIDPTSVLNQLRDGTGAPADQNVPGLPYYTESGFSNSALPTLAGVGVATTGTRFAITINNLQNGLTLNFPATATTGTLTVALVSPSDGVVTGSWTHTSGATTATVIYEVIKDDPNSLEHVNIVPTLALTDKIDVGNDIPALGLNQTTSTAQAFVSYSPISDVGVIATGPIPRFIDSHQGGDLIIYNACSCNLLFPFVTAQQNFDTGIAIANTSVDPYGTTPQTGPVELYFYGQNQPADGSAATSPASPTTTGAVVVPGGCVLTFIVSGGGGVANCDAAPSGNGTVVEQPGFQGYVIAKAAFQYCHGVAYVSKLGSDLPGGFYQAIQLDEPFALHGTTRTGQMGENMGH